MATAGVLVLGGAAVVTAALTAPPPSARQPQLVAEEALPAPPPSVAPPAPPPAPAGPVPTARVEAPVLAAVDLCTVAALRTALAAGDDAATIAAAGGAASFRAAVASGSAPCVPLDDPAHVWVVVDKTRPFHPIDYAPGPLTMPDGVRSLEHGELRTDAATALTALVMGARAQGAGEIALESGYRSHTTQQTSYGNQVGLRGSADADLVSARPGYSEHQSGLAGDVVACDVTCGALDDLAGTPQGRWVLAHAWEYGWIVRYEAGRTDVTGYLPEPWHLRYIGVALAGAYHDGGWHTLEEFFGLPPAPDYVG